MKTHQLKTWPGPFQAVLDGTKRHEIRVNDHGFAVGDVLELREWRPRNDGEKCTAIGCNNHADPRWYAPDSNGVSRPICDGHLHMPDVHPAGEYTGRSLRVCVTYLSPGGQWGLPQGLCVMSIEKTTEGE